MVGIDLCIFPFLNPVCDLDEGDVGLDFSCVLSCLSVGVGCLYYLGAGVGCLRFLGGSLEDLVVVQFLLCNF